MKQIKCKRGNKIIIKETVSFFGKSGKFTNASYMKSRAQQVACVVEKGQILEVTDKRDYYLYSKEYNMTFPFSSIFDNTFELIKIDAAKIWRETLNE